MAQKIISLCDVHLLRDEEVDGAEPVSFAINRARPRVLDLCADCREELTGELLRLLDETGHDAELGAPPLNAQAIGGAKQQKRSATRKRMGRPPKRIDDDDVVRLGMPSLTGIACPVCRAELSSRGEVRKHGMTAHNTTIPLDEIGWLGCPHCDQVRSSRHSMNQHHMADHADSSEVKLEFSCPEPDCDKSFAGRSALSLHRRRVHDQRAIVGWEKAVGKGEATG